MAQILRSPQAEDDLVSIGLFLAEEAQSLTAARAVLRTIEERAMLLSRHPFAGESRPDLGSGIRVFPVGKYPYLIIYRARDDGIEIARVLHSSRDVEQIYRQGLT